MSASKCCSAASTERRRRRFSGSHSASVELRRSLSALAVLVANIAMMLLGGSMTLALQRAIASKV